MTTRSIPNANELTQDDLLTKYEKQAIALVREFPMDPARSSRCFAGGNPYLPSETNWPRRSDKKPLHFLAQIDCGQLPINDQLPDTGFLFFFANMSDGTGWSEDRRKAFDISENWRVIYTHESGHTAREAPMDLGLIGGEYSDFSRSGYGIKHGEVYNTYYKWRLFPKSIRDWPDWDAFPDWWTVETNFDAHAEKIQAKVLEQYAKFDEIHVAANCLDLGTFEHDKFDESFKFPDLPDNPFPQVYAFVEAYARLVQSGSNRHLDDERIQEKEIVCKIKRQAEHWYHWAHSKGLNELVSNSDKHKFRSELVELARDCPHSLQNSLHLMLRRTWEVVRRRTGASEKLNGNFPIEYLRSSSLFVRHQMLGYTPRADHLTSDLKSEILLSLDSDDLTMMRFGDVDRIEFRISRHDLQERNFDKVEALIG